MASVHESDAAATAILKVYSAGVTAIEDAPSIDAVNEILSHGMFS